METLSTGYIINLEFEAIKLPPVTDILVLGKKLPQGKMGVLQSFDLISPDIFELIEINNHPTVEAIIINKNILSKISKDRIISILTDFVFPHISKGESIRVNFNIKIAYKNIIGELNAD